MTDRKPTYLLEYKERNLAAWHLVDSEEREHIRENFMLGFFPTVFDDPHKAQLKADVLAFPNNKIFFVM